MPGAVVLLGLAEALVFPSEEGKTGRKETRGGGSPEGRPLFVRSEATYEQRVPRGARGNGWEGGGASPAPSRYSVTHHGLLGAGLPSANQMCQVTGEDYKEHVGTDR